MRLSVVLGAFALFLLPTESQAAWDIFQSYVILDSGSGDQYLAGGLNADGASAFAGTDLGDFTAADALTLNGGELKTYKNGGSNVCGGTLNYRVYASGDTPGAFTALALPFNANLSGSDQKWAATGQAIDLLDALTAGDYVLELYWEADGNDSNPSGCGENKYDSDSGNNFTATFSVVQSSSCVSPTYQGYTYDVVQIGDQCWFAENLKATSFNNGDLIPLRETNGQWNGNTTPIRRRPGNSDANFDLYGYHYSGWTMTDARNVCPVGWHIPTKNDWMILMVEAGAPAEDTLNLSHLQTIGEQELTGQKLRGTSAGGTDDFGFNALMGGRSHGAGQGTKDLHVKGTWFFDMQDPNSSNVGGGEYFRIEMTTSTNHVQIARNRRKYGTTLRCMLDAPAVAAAIPGCMDSNYTEYDADATTDDGSCATPVVEGCTDPAYTEYNASANTDDGSCATPVVEGCTYPDYQEYDAAANTDDGSCATLMGCTDPAYIQYDANAVVDNGSCVHLIDPNCASPTFDGHTYDVVQIGGQCWFSENLQTTVYANGDAIPGELDNATWSGTTEGAQDIHSGDPANLTQFGRLYNWHAVQDARSICPTGWEMPSDADWNTLTAEVGPNPTAQLKSANFWNNPSSAGTDDYGFDARPGGYRFSSGNYFGTGTFGDYWSTTTWRQFNSTSELASSSVGTVYAEHGFSVRCLRGPDVMGCMDPLYNEYDPTATIDDGSCATLYDPCENALVLSSIEVDLSTTTLTAADGSATLTVTAGTPTSLSLTGINGAADYTIAQPGAIDGIAAGSYSVTATDANSCTSNTLMLIMPYSLCCECGVSDEDSDGLCDDVDNCTDKTATNYADPANGACTY